MSKKFWLRRNIFVTGGTGLLGSWLVKELVEADANVVVLIRDWVPQSNLILSGAIDKCVVVRGEVEDYFLLERVLNEYEIDTVFHLAAQTIVGTANRNPVSTFESNIKGTWNIMEACRRTEVKRVIVASSDKAYGEHKNLPYSEATPLKGRHPYDVSKSCADLIAQMYYHTYGLPVCVTRCGNFYGGGDLNFNRIVPGTIRSVLNNERPVIRSDGKYVRDYFYIKDGVAAYLLLAEKMLSCRVQGEAFNFSNENQISVNALARKITTLMGRTDLKPRILNQARNEIRHQYLSAKKAKERLSWKPVYSLEQGLEETIEWYRQYFSGRGTGQ